MPLRARLAHNRSSIHPALERHRPAMPALLKTFLVEDSPVIRQNLVATLEELAPVQVVGQAETQDDAINRLQSEFGDCALVIVDVVLRQGTGLGVLQQRKLHTPGRSFVVLTNYATAEISQRSLEFGAARVFDKSNDIDALIDYCHQLAAASQPPAAPADPPEA
jgi:two-component system, OmpR family, response regulator